MRLLTAALFASLLMFGCDDPAPEDAGTDASVDAGRDAGPDGGPDAGPPPTGCELRVDAGPVPDAGALPDPADFTRPIGPGGPSVSFEPSERMVPCAYLPVGETDENHHNTGFFLDGYLVRPWAHERGRGGVAVWDFDDPCNPELVANVLDEQIRETHSTGLSRIGGRWLAVASLTGVQFWDASDVTAPRMANDFPLEGVRYPDSYMRVVMSTFWQAPYLYVGASDNGIYVVDATDPMDPELVTQFDAGFRVGQVVVIGNSMFVFSNQGSVATTVDVSDPQNPRLIAGARWTITDGVTMDRFGRPIPLVAYFGHINGGYAYHPRLGLGAGLAIFDISDRAAPTFVGDYPSAGTGGYVYLHEGMAFVGLSGFGVALDVTDPAAPALLETFELEGDLDTVTPFGNVALVSVDDDAVPGQASAVVPFATAVDARGPTVNMVVPADGATDQSLTSRVGVTLDEFVEMNSVWEGSVILREVASGRVIETHLSGQEGVVNLTPVAPLSPATEYEVLIPAGGVTDLTGNPAPAGFRSVFTTVACED